MSEPSQETGLRPGEVIAGKYRVEHLLGRGGMGAVYAAQHEILGQRVAIKILSPDAESNAEVSARFLNEARAAARLDSDHIARVMDFGLLDNGRSFMVMEYLEGRDLSERDSDRSPVEEVVDYVLQAARGVAQAHALGIVHRDLKPANIFLARRRDGTTRIKVLDFGISKTNNPTLGSSASLTSTRSMLGSPAYMSPEQVRSPKAVDVRADVWALGTILYELLTGAPPFEAETLGELLVAIIEQPIRPVRATRPDVPPGLEAVIMRCLERQPANRYADAAALATALAPFAPIGRASGFASTPVGAETIELPGPAPAQTGRLPDAGGWGHTNSERGTKSGARKATIAAAILAVIAVAGASVVLVRGREGREATPGGPAAAISETRAPPPPPAPTPLPEAPADTASASPPPAVTAPPPAATEEPAAKAPPKGHAGSSHHAHAGGNPPAAPSAHSTAVPAEPPPKYNPINDSRN